MNRTKPRAPLWLMCDPAASMRLWLAIGLLYLGHWRCLRSRKSPGAWGTAWLTVYLSFAEALLRWAIARQARRLCGLAPSSARFFYPAEANTPDAWRARLATFVTTARTMDACARRLARRMKAAMEAKPQPVPAAQPSALACVVLGAPVIFMASWTRGIPAPP